MSPPLLCFISGFPYGTTSIDREDMHAFEILVLLFILTLGRRRSEEITAVANPTSPHKTSQISPGTLQHIALEISA